MLTPCPGSPSEEVPAVVVVTTPESPVVALTAQAQDPVLAKVIKLLTQGQLLQGSGILPGLRKAYLKDDQLQCRRLS
jgi:hypothetical protein